MLSRKGANHLPFAQKDLTDGLRASEARFGLRALGSGEPFIAESVDFDPGRKN
jgi:hypothetical protein